MNIIVDIYKECFPTETTKINYKNRNPLMNETLKSEIQVRDKLFVQSKKYPTQENKNNYKRYTNTNSSNQRKAERDYDRKQFNLHQTVNNTAPEYVCDLIRLNVKSTTIRTRASFDPCLLCVPQLVKRVLIHSLTDHLCMLLQHC